MINMPATIKDVARIAGCSIKTVSRVINSEPYVSDEIRQKVLAAIRSTGYAPNLAARQLVQKKTFAICVLLYPGFYQPASTLFSRLLEIGYDSNNQIFLQTYYPNRSISRDRLANLVNQHSYAGYIITPPCDADGFLADLFSTYRIPVIQINPMETVLHYPSIYGTDYAGAQMVTRHLLDLGHRRIAFLKGPRNMKSSHDRLRGFQDAMQESGLMVDESIMLDSEFTFDGGLNAIQILMAMSNPPTAVFAGHDEAAYGVIFGAQKLGYSVPEEISVAGFEDQLQSARIFPGLTTYHLPVDEQLVEAARLLIGILNNETVPPDSRTIEGSLVIRGSTAPPRKS